ncbi:hypothetical protein [Paenibacillus senegalensis]|uniref:hypothetical protein n=1 Tax=Paenibacillus senegalensis TaxID=1465766 RepID=UPI000287EDEB|nr:hypothetical protein [Paenibacillus senegalensis]
MLNEKKIYILFTDTGTLLSRAIGLYTKSALNHSSIAFDKNLSTIYSFGRKDPSNPWIGGFVKESLYGSLIRQGQNQTQCAIYSCSVSEDQYSLILGEVQRVEREQHKYRYNFLGLLGVALKTRIKRKKAYFCTQFVTSVFQAGGINLVSKTPCMTTPVDLENSPLLQLVYRGDLREYANSRLTPSSTLKVMDMKGDTILPA